MYYLIALYVLLCSTLAAQTPLIIGIAGGTGSGKTTLAEELLKTFPSRAVLISQDSYYKEISHLSFEERALTNFDHPDALDFDLLKTHLLALKNGKSVSIPTYNFATHSREALCIETTPQEIIIVEGILLFAVPEIRDLCDVKIFVETDDDIRLLRRMERDVNERGRDFKGIRDQYLTTVKPMHDAFVEPSKRHAHIVIPTFMRNDTGLAFLIAGLKHAL